MKDKTDELIQMQVTKCPHFTYGYNGYFGACNFTQGMCDLQMCQWKKEHKIDKE